MSHRVTHGTRDNTGCGVYVFALVIAAIAFAALTKGSLW